MLRIIIYIALACSVVILLSGCGYESPAEIKRELDVSLPHGTSKEDVIAYLERKEYEHSAEFKPELYYEKSKEISAVAPGKKYGVLTTARVYVTLRFDEQDQLIEIKIREVKTGL